MEREWAGTTYGNKRMHRWLIRMLRHVDARILYAFASVCVVPVCLAVNPSCGIAYRYFRLRHGFGRLKSAWSVYVNHCAFAQTVIDKFAMYAGRKFDIEIEGYPHFQALADAAPGFLQLSAHIGNYEIAGYSLKAQNKRFNALVFGGEKESVMENRRRLFASTKVNMIAVRPDMGHLFDINQALASGEAVSMSADRILGSDKHIAVDFIGAEADLPYGPFALAAMRSLDVITVNVVKTGLRKYKVIVTPLSYPHNGTRREQISVLARAYAGELERILHLYPTQWYNYFEFWK